MSLIGTTFNRLTVTGNGYTKYCNKKSRRFVTVVCSCGLSNQFDVRLDSLMSGNTKSCGCLHSEVAKSSKIVHNLSNSKLYYAWQHMIERCSNPNVDSYPLYGGRGIKVCTSWKESKNFFDWALSNGYIDSLQLDRVNVNGDYEPTNCRWVTPSEQAYNKRKQKNNTSGRTGVSVNKGQGKPFYAYISYKGQRINLGYFSSFGEAVDARENAEIKYFGYTKS